MIDFGLASTYKDDNGVHIEKKQINRFSGNFMFASLNSCRGNNKSRRDDIESAFYVLIYLLNGQKLPWSDFETRFKHVDMQFSDFLRQRLKRNNSCELFRMVP